MKQWRYSAVAVIFGACADRYVLQGYTPERSFDEMLADSTKVEGLKGIELVGGWHIKEENQDSVVKRIQASGMEISMLIPEIWATPVFGWGSFTSRDPKVRATAIAKVKNAMDLARQTGCNQVSPWFGHDGFDYVFQLDYAAAWDQLVEGLIECADYDPKVKVAVEYKQREPRTHALVSNLAKCLLLLQEVNRPNVGINLDVGHALAGMENMAESVAMLKRFGNKLYHLHVNDNYRSWDDDMIPGSVHTLEWMEFFYWLDRTGYDGWISLDVFAYHERDKIAVARESLAWLEALREAAGRLDPKAVEKVLDSGDAMKSTKLVREALFG